MTRGHGIATAQMVARLQPLNRALARLMPIYAKGRQTGVLIVIPGIVALPAWKDGGS
jgi:hypothetical protein